MLDQPGAAARLDWCQRAGAEARGQDGKPTREYCRAAQGTRVLTPRRAGASTMKRAGGSDCRLRGQSETRLLWRVTFQI